MFYKKKSNNSIDQSHSQQAHPFIKNKLNNSPKTEINVSLQQVLEDLRKKNYKFSNN